MPPQLLFDVPEADRLPVVFDQEVIREYNPQRGGMEMLNGIVYVDSKAHRLIGYKDVRDDEFWVSGHIPGRPLFPGVLMIECGAQLASFYTRKFSGWTGFVGFGGVDECRFRQQVSPGARIYLYGEQLWERHSRMCCKIQGVVNGTLAFETKIIGVQL
jgi:3-hydroxyacyl-[acyl-carrier-protein] dehydratase